MGMQRLPRYVALCSIFSAAVVRAVPAPAEVGIFLANVDCVEGKSGWWRGDVVVISRWSEAAFPANRQPVIGLVDAKVDFEDESRSFTTGGLVTRTVRQTAQFYFDGNYWLFPFDQQELVVRVDAVGLASEELSLTEDRNFTGIAPVNERTGRHFKTAQYRVASWDVGSEMSHFTHGMTYSKSIVQLSVGVKRHLPYYLLNCFILPSLTIGFAMATFMLPMSPITPRVMIGFISFLGQFVHLKSQMSFLPQGVWCWLFSGLFFSMIVLSMAILSNIVSARIAGVHAPSSAAHDRFCRRLLPTQYTLGYVFLFAFKNNHLIISIIASIIVIVVHTIGFFTFCQQAHDAKEEEGDDDGGRVFWVSKKEDREKVEARLQQYIASGSGIVTSGLGQRYQTVADAAEGGEEGGEV